MMRLFPRMMVCALAAFLAWTVSTRTAAAQSNAADSASTGEIILLPVEKTPDPIVTGNELHIENYTEGGVKIRREINYLSDASAVNHGKYEEFYKNGQKFAEGQYEHGVQVGQWNYWFENGNECKTVQFKNGVPDGKWTVFWPDGKQRAIRQYIGGQEHGIWTQYAEDGETVLEERHYENGLPDGKWVRYHPSGKPHVEEHFQQGKRHGKLTEWNQDGEVVQEMEFKAGKLDGRLVIRAPGGTDITQYYRDGQLVPEGPQAGSP